MLNLLIALSTFAYALIVAFARFDLESTYFVFGAIYAVCVGGLLGNQPRLRIRGYRLHLRIAGICAFFILVWYVAGTESFSGWQTTAAAHAQTIERIASRVLLLYLGIYLASRASDSLTEVVSKLPIRIGTWLDVFMKTPTEIFTETNRKLRAILVLVLIVSGVWAVVTGDFPTGASMAKDLARLIGK
jgi:hypothetical protein